MDWSFMNLVAFDNMETCYQIGGYYDNREAHPITHSLLYPGSGPS